MSACAPLTHMKQYCIYWNTKHYLVNRMQDLTLCKSCPWLHRSEAHIIETKIQTETCLCVSNPLLLYGSTNWIVSDLENICTLNWDVFYVCLISWWTMKAGHLLCLVTAALIRDLPPFNNFKNPKLTYFPFLLYAELLRETLLSD